MKNKYLFVTVLLAVILAVGAGLTSLYVHIQDSAEAEGELTVVTSFYPIYVATENIIGDAGDVRLENLSEPQTGCLHDYQMTAEDMKLLSTADVFVINGGGIESFLSDVARAYPELTIVNACEELDLPEDNPHAWMNMEDYIVQIQTIAAGLQAADPDHAEEYAANAQAYEEKVRALKEEYADQLAGLAGQPVISFHEAYAYVAQEWGMQVVGEMDLDEERQVSAGEVAEVLSTIEQYDVSVVLAEELYGKSMGDMVEQESDVTVLYLDPLNRGDYDADSYLENMRSNLELLASLLK